MFIGTDRSFNQKLQEGAINDNEKHPNFSTQHEDLLCIYEPKLQEDAIDQGDVQRERDIDCRPDDDLAAFALNRFIRSKLFFNAIFISCT